MPTCNAESEIRENVAKDGAEPAGRYLGVRVDIAHAKGEWPVDEIDPQQPTYKNSNPKMLATRERNRSARAANKRGMRDTVAQSQMPSTKPTPNTATEDVKP